MLINYYATEPWKSWAKQGLREYFKRRFEELLNEV